MLSSDAADQLSVVWALGHVFRYRSAVADEPVFKGAAYKRAHHSELDAVQSFEPCARTPTTDPGLTSPSVSWCLRCRLENFFCLFGISRARRADRGSWARVSHGVNPWRGRPVAHSTVSTRLCLCRRRAHRCRGSCRVEVVQGPRPGCQGRCGHRAGHAIASHQNS